MDREVISAYFTKADKKFSNVAVGSDIISNFPNAKILSLIMAYSVRLTQLTFVTEILGRGK